MRRNISKFISTALISIMTLTSVTVIPVSGEEVMSNIDTKKVISIDTAKAQFVDENKDYLDDNGSILLSGVITETSSQGYVFIQDESGGLALKLRESSDLKIGNKVEVTGTLGSSYGFAYLDVKSKDDIKVVSDTEIKSLEVSLKDIGEKYEGSLVTIKDVTIESGPEYGEYKVLDGNENFRIKPKDDELLSVGTTYKSITGVVYYGYGKYSVIPRSSEDIQEDDTTVKPIKSSVRPGDIRLGRSVELVSATSDATIYYTLDGTNPTSSSIKYDKPIAIKEDTTISAVALKDGLKDSDISFFEYKVVKSNADLLIPQIQGKSHKSPYENTGVVNVKGIVTSKLNYKFDFNSKEKITGFYMQDPIGDGDNSTSDAIFVKTNEEVNIGDEVSVSGIVKEDVKAMDFYAYDIDNQLSITTIHCDNVIVLNENVPLPTPVIIGEKGRTVPHDEISSEDFNEYNPSRYAIDFYESLEGMLVKVEQPLVVAPEHNRVLSIVPDNGSIAKVDGDLSTMGGVILGENDMNTEIIGLNGAIRSLGSIKSIEAGAHTTGDVVGIMDYEWASYQIYITKELPEFTNIDRAVDSLSFNKSQDELTIASYNVYNHGGDDNEKNPNKAKGIAFSIVNSMENPDIIGLVEVQDNDGSTDSDTVDASKVYQVFIDEIKAIGGPEYKWVDIPPVDDQEGGQPGGNIRVGFLYNPDRVSLKSGSDKGNSTESVTIKEDGSLSLNPGRIEASNPAFEDTRKSLAAEFTFRDEDVIVIANHLSSKGGDNATYGNIQPAVKHSAVNRIKQAQIINDFVDEVLTKNPDANVVALGDFNDFHFSEALRTLKGQGADEVMANMIDSLPKSEQFTYSYGGNSQVLDNILVTNRLKDTTKVDVLNINSILSDKDKSRRHSDHDAVIVSIDLDKSKEFKLDITNLEVKNITCNNSNTIIKGDTISIDGNYSTNDKNKTINQLLSLYKVTRRGRLIPVLSSNNTNDDSMTIKINTNFLPKGKYRAYYTLSTEMDLKNTVSKTIDFTVKKAKRR